MNGPPCHTKFDLFSIVLGKSDETMPYRLDLGNSFGVVYIAVTYLVQELCQKTEKSYFSKFTQIDQITKGQVLT